MAYVIHIYSLPLTKGYSLDEDRIKFAEIFKKNEKFRKNLVKKIGHPVKIFGPHRWNPFYYVPTEFVNLEEAQALADIIWAEVKAGFDDGRVESVFKGTCQPGMDPNNRQSVHIFELKP